MAGQPEFIRAKRLKFFHTTAEILAKGSLELAPTTSLILHPTTDLIASPEGDMIFRTAASFASDVSIMGNLYVNGTMIINATAYITDDLQVTETVTVGSTIHGKATASIDGNLNVTGAAAVTGKLSTASVLHGKATASIDGALKVLGAGTITGNLWEKGNASVDGTLDLTGAAHLRSSASIDGTVNAAGGGNVVVRKKAVISYSDFTAASIEERVDFQDIAVGDSISELFFQLATPFRYDTGPATVLGSICRVVFGDRADRDGFSKTQLCGSIVAADTFFNTAMGGIAGKGVYLFNTASNLPKSKVYTATTNLQCGLTASNFNVASLTQGAIYAYYDIMQIPE